MPNWTENHVTMENIRKEDLFRFDEDGHKVFDFNKLIPEPHKIEDCDKDCIADKQSHIEEDKERPWFNWYEWHIKYWGTKWNACHSYYYDDDGDDKDDDVVSFDTAWSFPRPIAIALSKMFPDREVIWDYVNEDFDGYHTIYYKNGKIIKATVEYVDENGDLEDEVEENVEE